MEHGFIDHWRRFSHALKQRNALLKTGQKDSSNQLDYWNRILVPSAEYVTNVRQKYMMELEETLSRSLTHFFMDDGIRIVLRDGWTDAGGYSECLDKTITKDLRYGFTTIGPHKADLEICAGNHLAKDYLSRGQKKLTVYAIRLAQIEQLQRKSGRQVSLLLDDLPSELDTNNCEKVCKEIKRIGCQVFITSINNTDLNSMIIDTLDPNVFHVEHGTVSV